MFQILANSPSKPLERSSSQSPKLMDTLDSTSTQGHFPFLPLLRTPLTRIAFLGWHLHNQRVFYFYHIYLRGTSGRADTLAHTQQGQGNDIAAHGHRASP
jgi:hypothetical protein